MKVRKEQRAPLTQTAITRMAGELQQAHAGGMSVDDCIGLAAEKGWRGFKYQWALNANSDNPRYGQQPPDIDWDVSIFDTPPDEHPHDGHVIDGEVVS